MTMEEGTVETMHGFDCGMASPMTGRSHDNFNLAAGRFIGLDRSQDAVDRVREIAIKLIFKLPVPQNRKQFGHEREF